MSEPKKKKVKQLGINSEPIPSVQTTKLYQLDKELESQVELANVVLENLKQVNPRYWAICRIMYVTGCRVGEALSVECKSVDNYGLFYFQGSKGGSNKVVNDSELSVFMRRFFRQSGLVFHGITRQNIYRAVKQFGLEFKAEGNKKVSVTHFFRHVYTKRMRALEVDKDTIKQELRHKSKKTQEHYGRD